MNSDYFAIPVAFDPENRVHRPEVAEKGLLYKCPSCLIKVILRRGEIRAPHFAHSGDTPCNPDTIRHKAAIRIIQASVEDWKAGKGKRPVIVQHHPLCQKISSAELEEGVDQAKPRTAIESGRVLDVALFAGERLALGVEVFIPARLEANLKREVRSPWVELDAEDVIANPDRWKCRDSKGVFPDCQDCLDYVLKAILAQKQLEEREQEQEKRRHPVYLSPFDQVRLAEEARRTSSQHLFQASSGELWAQPRPAPPASDSEWTLSNIAQVLDLVVPGDVPVRIPGRGAVNQLQFANSLREGLRSISEMQSENKRALLWRLWEFLATPLPVKGDTSQELDQNRKKISAAMNEIRKL